MGYKPIQSLFDEMASFSMKERVGKSFKIQDSIIENKQDTSTCKNYDDVSTSKSYADAVKINTAANQRLRRNQIN
jgi:hypothetical protein